MPKAQKIIHGVNLASNTGWDAIAVPYLLDQRRTPANNCTKEIHNDSVGTT